MTSAPEDADLILLKCPSDIGIRNTDRKGTLEAPSRILEGLNFEEDVFVDEVFPDEFDLKESQSRIGKRAEGLLEFDKPIVFLGGDHSIAFPSLRRMKEKFPRLKVLWVDAHPDAKEVRLDRGVPHDAVVRELINQDFELEDFVFLGQRESDPDEKIVELDSFQRLTTRKLEDLSAEEIEGRIQELFGGDSFPVYLSFDIDALDRKYLQGTTFPSEGGLSPSQAEKLVNAVSDLNLKGADLVEYSPPFSREGEVQKVRKVLKDITSNITV
ncbi:MAG: arginase family protein [Candidatus Nanohaloarchaeota archaeon QJJ-9]|nr:arginase family protein [Candidatus Nanohaloarchaeota archaeon QJJ-9]